MVDEVIEEINELLNLPIWKRRHELYSIWVLTRIIESFGGAGEVDFLLNGKVFHIPFAAKRLAKVNNRDPEIYICSEVRYALNNPKGKGRIAGMQPDYTITTDLSDPPQTANALIKCKQYLKQASKSFAAALEDYANGQPAAHVLLVNYGPASSTIKKKIPSRLHHRTDVIGELNPSEGDNINKFYSILKRVFPEPPPSRKSLELRVGESLISTERLLRESLNEMEVKLYWKEQPLDLDLHVVVGVPSVDISIGYQNKGSIEEYSWIRFVEDCRNGFGPETIVAQTLLNGVYGFYVHPYSADLPLAECGAVVTVVIRKNGITKTFTCPDEGEGDWWWFFDFDTGNNELIERHIIDFYSPVKTGIST